MTVNQIDSILKQTGFPVAKICFFKATTLPFIAYTPFTENLFTDSKVVKKKHSIRIELHTKEIYSQAEETFEKVLKDNNILWPEKDCVYISSEQHFMLIYNIETEEKI